MSLHHPDFGFSYDSDQLTPMAVTTLLAEYADGRRQFHNLDLRESNLANTKLMMVNLEESSLQRANLTSANLAGATLNHVDLSSANLTNANLIAADLVRARLASANLSGAVFSGANLSGASLRKANLTNCIFAGTNLSGVDFSGAILSNVILGGANLRGANLSDVDLSEIDLSDVDLTETILPEGLAGQQWMRENRDFSANFGEAVPGWEHPTGDYVTEETPYQPDYAATDYAQGYYLQAGDTPGATLEEAAPANGGYDNDAVTAYQPGYTEGDAETGYAEPEYAEAGYAETGYTAAYAEAGYTDGGYTETGYAEASYTEASYAEAGYAEGGYIPQGGEEYANASPEEDALYINALDAIDAIALSDATEMVIPFPSPESALPLDAAEGRGDEAATELSPFSTPFATDGPDLTATASWATDHPFEPAAPVGNQPFAHPTPPDSGETTSALFDGEGPANPFAVPSQDGFGEAELGDTNASNVLGDFPDHGVPADPGTPALDTLDGAMAAGEPEESTQFFGAFGVAAEGAPSGVDQELPADSTPLPFSAASEEPWGSPGAFHTQEDLGDDLTAEDPPTAGFSSEGLAPDARDAEEVAPADLAPAAMRDRPRESEPEADPAGVAPAVTADMAPADQPPTAPGPTPVAAPASPKSTIPAVNTRMVQSIQAALGRRVNYSLQRKLLDIYRNQCAITGCDIQPLLETVFVTSHDRERADHPSQCLVLRSDLRTLYELKLLAIHPTTLKVLLAPQLIASDYGPLQGRRITLPDQKIYQPNPGGLAQNLQDCLWYDASYAASPLPTVPEPASSSMPEPEPAPTPKPSWPLVPLLIACGLGGFTLGGLVFGVAHYVLRTDSVATMSTPPAAQASPEASNRINIQAGDVRYRQQGLLIDQKAYLSLEQAQRWGLISEEVPQDAQRQYQGQPYVSLSYLVATGTPVEWNAPARTAVLDCCQAKPVETINLRIQGRDWPSAGIIVDNQSYIPQQKLESLTIDLSRLSSGHSIEYQDEVYLRASDLKDLSVAVNWDSEARVLSIEN